MKWFDMKSRTISAKVGLLISLYLAQGLPFGFQTKTLPVYLREEGISLTSISFLGALSLPWLLKIFWAPIVDNYYSSKYGRRKSWIIPLLVLMILTCILLVFTVHEVSFVLPCVFILNLAASIQDIAVDGLAIDILGDDEVGLGNTAQVVGFKIGMLSGGGILTWICHQLGVSWAGVFVLMAILISFSLILTLLYDEKPTPNIQSNEQRPSPKYSNITFLRRIQLTLSSLSRSFTTPSSKHLLLVLLTYKSGEVMSDVMFKPFLVDHGISASTIGLWTGVYAMFFSIMGSIIGGLVPKYFSITLSIVVTGAIRIIPQAFRAYVAATTVSSPFLIVIICMEALVGGVLTTLIFSVMMHAVNKDIGATHYTAFAVVEIFGKSISSFGAGFVADRSGYFFLFSLGLVFSILAWPLMWKLHSSTNSSHEMHKNN